MNLSVFDTNSTGLGNGSTNGSVIYASIISYSAVPDTNGTELGNCSTINGSCIDLQTIIGKAGVHHSDAKYNALVCYLAASLIFGALVRQLLKLVHFISLPYYLLLVVAGFLLNLLDSWIVLTNHTKFEGFAPLLIPIENPKTIFNIYMPICIFDALFNAHVMGFKTVWKHVFLVVIPTIAVTYLCVWKGAFLFLKDEETGWTDEHLFLVVAISMVPGPQVIRSFLQSHMASLELQVVFDIESVVSIAIAIFVYETCMNSIAVDNSFFSSAVSNLWPSIAGILLGVIFAAIAYSWISRIPKDIVNSTAIIFTFAFLSYIFCESLDISGTFCVWALAFYLSHNKDTMSSQTIQVFNKFTQVIIMCMVSYTCICAGYILWDKIAAVEITIFDFYFTLTFYAGIITLRSLFLFGLYPIYRKHYLSSLLSVTVVVSTFLRGTYSFVIAFTVFSLDDQVASKEIKAKIFILVVFQVLLSYIINEPVSGFAMMYRNKESAVNEKFVMIRRTADYLVEVKTASIHKLKNQIFTADADWDRVMEYIKLKNDFMRLYKNKQWLKHKAKVQRKTSVLDAMVLKQQIKDEAFKQMVGAERETFRQMFDQGTLSKSSVLHLKMVASNAMEDKSLMNASQIIVITQPSRFKEKVEEIFIYSYQTNNFKISKFVIQLTLALLDICMNILSLQEILFINQELNSLHFTDIYNIVVFALLFNLIIYHIILGHNKAVYAFQFYLAVFLLMVTMFDQGFTILALILELAKDQHRKLFMEEKFTIRTVCTCSRVLRLFLLVETSTAFQEKMLAFIKKAIEKRCFFTCDMAKGYLGAARFSDRKVQTIVKDQSVANHIQFSSHKSRLEISQHLGLVQIKNLGTVTSFKTRTAIRLVLNCLKSTVNEIRDSGLIGETDSILLRKSIEARFIDTKTMPTCIPAVGLMQLIENIPWVGSDKDLAKFILTHGKNILLSPNDVIATQGHMLKGIFLVTFGLVRIEQSVNKDIAAQKLSRKALYFTNTEKDPNTILKGFATRGYVIGEDSILTDQPGHKTFRCATHVEVLFVDRNEMIDNIGRADVDEYMNDLEQRMWYIMAIRQAVGIMIRDVDSHGLFRAKVINRMVNSYMIDGNIIKVIDLHHKKVAVAILISGHARNFYTQSHYAAPVIIPSYVHKLVCEPQRGKRVIFLIIRTSTHESFEILGHDDHHAQPEEDDLMSLSSGSSFGGPHYQLRGYYKKVPDLTTRLLQPMPNLQDSYAKFNVEPGYLTKQKTDTINKWIPTNSPRISSSKLELASKSVGFAKNLSKNVSDETGATNITSKTATSQGSKPSKSTQGIRIASPELAPQTSMLTPMSKKK